MCGIAGLLDLNGSRSRELLLSTTLAMTDSLAHRGPDGDGSWVDESAGIALGHRRLAVVDLSPAGAQPMASSCGRYVLTFNGEVYNAEELRPALAQLGLPFKGHSDTEVIVQGFSAWGIEPTLKRLVGMFAFAIWDRQERTLTLVRDRLGIKPLYWAIIGRQFLFGSELKALRAARPEWQPKLNCNSMASYVRFGYVPNPHSIYQDVHQLSPGAMLVIGASGEPRIEKFWELEEVAREGQRHRWSGTEDEAVDRLEALLSDAVRCRMVADVPLGAFLSGGIDSSTVVALMQTNSSKAVKTFTISFQEQAFNEAQHAAKVARHLGTDHTELRVDAATALDVIPQLPDMFDEPFADSSQIPTYLISKLTRRSVTVALSGDGGDEVFAGYNRHVNARAVGNLHDYTPELLRSLTADAIGAVSPDRWSQLGNLVPNRWRPSEFGDKMRKFGSLLGNESDDWSVRAASLWPEPNKIVRNGIEARGTHWNTRNSDIVPDRTERLQFVDTLTYLPDDILTKVDRASMAVALEARVPLIDHRVVAFSWSLPPHMKVQKRTGKWLLRKVLDRHVPRQLVERPKMGFTLPIGQWLRGPLRDWAEDLLSDRRLQADGLFHAATIRSKWNEHLEGKCNWAHQLWVILMFQAWRQRWQISI